MASVTENDTPRGHPIDLRPRQQTLKWAAGPIGDFEFMSARVIARLTGERVLLEDDGSKNGMADIRIEYADREPGYAEVWTDIDEDYAEMHSSLMKPGRQLPLELARPALGRVWFVIVSGACSVRTLVIEIEEILVELERAGVTFERVGELASSTSIHSAVQQLLNRGVVRLSSRPCAPDEAGVVRLLPSGITGPALISWEPVIGWIAETLSSTRLADVRSKLAATKAGERHLFLGVTYTSPSDVFFALSDYEQTLPDKAPSLPREITHLWLMKAFPTGRCIAWFPDRGWFDPVQHWATD